MNAAPTLPANAPPALVAHAQAGRHVAIGADRVFVRGMGLSAKPRDGDYRWSSMAGWTGNVIDGLGLDRVHLVVHDLTWRRGTSYKRKYPRRASTTSLGWRARRIATHAGPATEASPAPHRSIWHPISITWSGGSRNPMVGLMALRDRNPKIPSLNGPMRPLRVARNVSRPTK